MNSIQKALRMLNESYKSEQQKRNLTESVVDQDGDIEVLSFNLRDFTKDFSESCKESCDEACDESCDEGLTKSEDEIDVTDKFNEILKDQGSIEQSIKSHCWFWPDGHITTNERGLDIINQKLEIILFGVAPRVFKILLKKKNCGGKNG